MPLTLIRADITTLKTDAIVNAANNHLTWGTGVCGTIFNRCDTARLTAACAQIGYCATGHAVITPPFGLPCGYIIHAVGPVWQGGTHNEDVLLRSCYTHSLDIAKQYNLHSIAFPLISSGNYGYPHEQALSIALSAIEEWLLNNDAELQVYLTLFDRSSYEAGNALYKDIRVYINDKYVDDQILSRQPFQSNTICFSKHPSILENRSQQSSDCFEMADHSLFDSSKFAESPKEQYIHEEEHLASILSPEEHLRSIVRRLSDVIHQTHETFQQMLFRLIDERNMSDVEVYKRANLDRRLFSRIRSNPDYHPNKSTVLALAIALKLNIDQTSDLLRRAGFALSPNSEQDLIVEFCIQRKIFNIFKVNEILFEFHQKTLGARTDD